MASYTEYYEAALKHCGDLGGEARGSHWLAYNIFRLVAVALNSWHVASLRTQLLFRPRHSYPQRCAQIYTHYAILPSSSLHGAAAVLRSHGAMR
jgi:hypothetical protein